VSQLAKKSTGSGNRIYVDNIKDVLTALLGEVEQDYFKDKASLAKRITSTVVKQSKKINWKGIYEEVRKKFLSFFPGDDDAITYIDNLENQFIH
jgi:hypothetical protein